MIAGELSLLPGVESLIDQLKAGGYRLAIGTSTPRVNLHFMLEHTGIEARFDAFVTSEDVTRSKPHPDTFLTAADRIGVPASGCVVVEDAVQGVQAGKAGGMAVLAVTTTRPREDLHQADRIVDSLAEVTADDFDELIGSGSAVEPA